MNTATFDTLSAARSLEAAGIESKQAEAIVGAIRSLPWAEPWARVTKALAGAVAALTRHLNWREAARHFHLDWKSVATIVKRAVAYGLARRRRRPLHWIGVDEVSRRKGHRYLTVVYDLERRTLLWVGEDRTEQTLREFFSPSWPGAAVAPSRWCAWTCGQRM